MTSRVSKRQNIFLEDLLEKQASFRAGTSVRSVLQHILSPLRDFEFVREMTARRNRIDANKRRLRRIFLNLFPDEPGTPPRTHLMDLTGEKESQPGSSQAGPSQSAGPSEPSKTPEEPPASQQPQSQELKQPPASQGSSVDKDYEEKESSSSSSEEPEDPETPEVQTPPRTPPRRSARLQGHPQQYTHGMQGRTPPRKPARKPKKVTVEDSGSEYENDDPAPEPARPNTKQVSGRKRKFEELIQAIRNLSSKQQEELISEIQPKRRKNTACTNVGGRQVLVPTGNADSQFDDKMPALPRWYKYVPEMNDDDTTWRSVSISPRLWLSDAEEAIGDIATYLHSIFIPKGHRAYAFCQDKDQLRFIHHTVYWQAAYNYFVDNPRDPRLHMFCTLWNDWRASDTVLAKRDDVTKGPNDLINHRWFAVAELSQQVSEAYFAQKWQQLVDKGYIVLESFLDCSPSKFPWFLTQAHKGFKVPSERDASCTMIIRLWRFMLQIFPGEENMIDEKHRKLWSFIINQGENEDPAGRNRGIGRCASTNYAVTTEIERRNPKLAEARAYLDVRLGQIMEFLRVRTGNNPHREGVEQEKATFVPKTGGRFLLNSEGCPRQVLHSDFDLEQADGMSVIDPRFNPGYFMVATGPGDHAVPIWVNKLGHIALWSWKQEEERRLFRDGEVTKVWIPPSSVL